MPMVSVLEVGLQDGFLVCLSIVNKMAAGFLEFDTRVQILEQELEYEEHNFFFFSYDKLPGEPRGGVGPRAISCDYHSVRRSEAMR